MAESLRDFFARVKFKFEGGEAYQAMNKTFADAAKQVSEYSQNLKGLDIQLTRSNGVTTATVKVGEYSGSIDELKNLIGQATESTETFGKKSETWLQRVKRGYDEVRTTLFFAAAALTAITVKSIMASAESKTLEQRVKIFTDTEKDWLDLSEAIDKTSKASRRMFSRSQLLQASEFALRLGVDVKNITGNLDVLTKQAARSGLDLDSIFQRIQSISLGTSSAGTKSLKQLVPNPEIYRDLVEELKKVNDPAQRAELVIKAISDSVAKLGPKIDEAFNTPQARLQRFKNTIADVFEEMGNGANEFVLPLTDKLSDLLGKLLETHPEMFKVAGGAVAISSGLFAAFNAAGAFATSFVALEKFFKETGIGKYIASLFRLKLEYIFTGKSAMGAGFSVRGFMGSLKLKEIFSAAGALRVLGISFRAIGVAIRGALVATGIGILIALITELVSEIIAGEGPMLDFFKNLWGWISKIAEPFVAAGQAIGTFFGIVIGKAKEIWDSGWQFVGDTASKGWSDLQKVSQHSSNLLVGIFTGDWDKVKTEAGNLWNVVSDKFSAGYDLIDDLTGGRLSGFVNSVKQFGSIIGEAFASAFDSIGQWIGEHFNLWKWITDKVEEGKKDFFDFFDNLLSPIKKFFGQSPPRIGPLVGIDKRAAGLMDTIAEAMSGRAPIVIEEIRKNVVEPIEAPAFKALSAPVTQSVGQLAQPNAQDLLNLPAPQPAGASAPVIVQISPGAFAPHFTINGAQNPTDLVSQMIDQFALLGDEFVDRWFEKRFAAGLSRRKDEYGRSG